MCPIHPALCTTHLQLLLPGPPTTGSRQCLPQTGQGQERAFTSLLRFPSSQPCLTGGYIRTYVHTYMQVTARTSASFLQTHPQPNCSPSLPHLTHTPHTSPPHPTHTSSTPHPHLTHTLYPPFPSRTPAFMCVRCSSRNYTKDSPLVSCHCLTWQFSVSMAMRRTRH